jgi:hypothetical protein
MWMYLLPGPKKQERGTRFDKKGKKCEKKTSIETGLQSKTTREEDSTWKIESQMGYNTETER